MAKGLNREVLARTALRIVDEQGLAKLSMRRLADELGVDPMAAYKHVPNKEALLDAVLDAVLGDVALDDLTGDIEQRLSTGVHRVFSAMTAHPNAAPLLSARKWFTPAGMAIIEWGMRELTSAGVEPRQAVLTMNATGLFLTGLAQAVAGSDGADPLLALQSFGQHYPVTLQAFLSGEGRFTYDALLDFWLETMFASVAPDGAQLGSATARSAPAASR